MCKSGCVSGAPPAKFFQQSNLKAESVEEFATYLVDVLIALKANATRQMREDELWPHEHSPWADKGSKRNLWNEQSIWEACNYVNNAQGDDLPDFDRW